MGEEEGSRLQLTVTADLRDRDAVKVAFNGKLDEDGDAEGPASLFDFSSAPMTSIEIDDFEGHLDIDKAPSSFVIHARKDIHRDEIDLLGQAGPGDGEIQLRLPTRYLGGLIWVTLAPAPDVVAKLDARLTEIDCGIREAVIEQQKQLSLGKFGSDATKRLGALLNEQRTVRRELEEALQGGSSKEANADESGLDSLGPLFAALGQLQPAQA